MKKFVLCIFTVILAAAAPIFPVFCETGGYVAFGDSIAAGYGLDSPAEAYPSVMAQTLGFRLQNLAKNGQTSTELKARIAGLSDAEKRAVAEARLITISIGGNDLIGEKNRQFVLTEALISVISGDYTMSDEMAGIYETLKENLTDSIAMLRELNPDAVILLQTLYNPYLTGSYTYHGYNIGAQLDFYIQEINKIYAEVLAESGGFLLADVAEQMNGNSDYFYTTFDFHPTAAGHAKIAEILTAAYRKATVRTPEESTAAGGDGSSAVVAPQEATAADTTSDTAAETTTDVPETSSEVFPPETTADADTTETQTVPAAAGIDGSSDGTPSSADRTAKLTVIITAVLICAAVLFLFCRGLARGKQA